MPNKMMNCQSNGFRNREITAIVLNKNENAGDILLPRCLANETIYTYSLNSLQLRASLV